MANLSQEKRQRMLAFLETIREEHKDDDEVLIALGEIESELNAKKYGLVWERHEEAVDIQTFPYLLNAWTKKSALPLAVSIFFLKAITFIASDC